jgi:hypothetical protein
MFAKSFFMKRLLMQFRLLCTPYLRLMALAALGVAGGSLCTIYSVTPGNVQAESNRVFELRVYHVVPGQLLVVQSIFKEHTLPMFARHGITSIGLWVPQDRPGSENTLICLVAHPSREEAKKNWNAFYADPEIEQVLRKTNVEKIDSTFLDPVDFSPLK